MTTGIILLIVGLTCVGINILYMVNSDVLNRMSGDESTLLLLAALILAPFTTLCFLIYYLNLLSIQVSKNKKKVKR